MTISARHLVRLSVAALAVIAIFSGHASRAADLKVLLPTWPIQDTGLPLSDAQLKVWRDKADFCPRVQGHFDAFPSKGNADAGADVGDYPTATCDDGDQTLFNGLLCAAGVAEGCSGVKQAQAADGRWFRSPARRLLWEQHCFSASPLTGNHFRDRCANGFSPDMALGVLLYVMETGDSAAYQRWLNWIDASIDSAKLCRPDDLTDCKPVKWPTLCTHDIGYRAPDEKPPAIVIDGRSGGMCSMRPFDPLDFSAVTEATLITVPARYAAWEAQTRVLGQQLLAGLTGNPAISSLPPLLIMSATDKEHFPLHLDAARVLLRMQIANPGLKLANLPSIPEPMELIKSVAGGMLADGTDPTYVNAVAQVIASRARWNPFYQLLAEGPTPAVRALIIERCPSETDKTTKDNWIWEKDSENDGNGKLNSMGWDCIFVGSLYNRMLVKKDLLAEFMDLVLKFADQTDQALQGLQQASQVAEGALALTEQGLEEANRALQTATDFVSTGYAAAKAEVDKQSSETANRLSSIQAEIADIQRRIGDLSAQLANTPKQIEQKVMEQACNLLGDLCQVVEKIQMITNPDYTNAVNAIADLNGQLLDLQTNALREVNERAANLVVEGTNLAARFADLQLKLQQAFFETQIDVAKFAVSESRKSLAKAREEVGKARKLYRRAQGQLAVWRKPSRGN
ncbi:hypothetical protein [Roseateles sp. LYH14W]|uniref:Uncharacterized protein n=1 Tax=Pelomonas parva TaxID=3299032 RepID=A0ABW7F8B9_9BURK